MESNKFFETYTFMHVLINSFNAQMDCELSFVDLSIFCNLLLHLLFRLQQRCVPFIFIDFVIANRAESCKAIALLWYIMRVLGRTISRPNMDSLHSFCSI
eukprot:208410_1